MRVREARGLGVRLEAVRSRSSLGRQRSGIVGVT